MRTQDKVDPRFSFRYPLREWGWDRARCAKRIRDAGLPVPVKSSCFICGAMKTHEVASLPPWCLRLIVLIEARAAPRLRTVDGLWRHATATRPGSMTAFIRSNHLLADDEIDAIMAGALVDLVEFQHAAALIPLAERSPLRRWIDRFNEGASVADRATPLA